MNLIKELTQKYNGEYSEANAKRVNSPHGRFIYEPKSGTINIDETKISININEVDGAMPVTEPFRITLHLEKPYDINLTIFPKDFWYHFLDFFNPKKKAFIPKPILKQFWLEGNDILIQKLVSNHAFTKSIIDERIYIESDEKTAKIILTPENGIKDLVQFEKFITILQIINKQIILR
jgi:hypothetical protein